MAGGARLMRARWCQGVAAPTAYPSRTPRISKYYNYEHFLLYIHCETKTKTKFAVFKKKSWIFTFNEFLKFLLFINLPWVHVRSHPKFGPDWFSRFDVYWTQTGKQSIYLDVNLPRANRREGIHPILPRSEGWVISDI